MKVYRAQNQRSALNVLDTDVHGTQAVDIGGYSRSPGMSVVGVPSLGGGPGELITMRDVGIRQLFGVRERYEYAVGDCLFDAVKLGAGLCISKEMYILHLCNSNFTNIHNPLSSYPVACSILLLPTCRMVQQSIPGL